MCAFRWFQVDTFTFDLSLLDESYETFPSWISLYTWSLIKHTLSFMNDVNVWHWCSIDCTVSDTFRKWSNIYCGQNDFFSTCRCWWFFMNTRNINEKWKIDWLWILFENNDRVPINHFIKAVEPFLYAIPIDWF